MVELNFFTANPQRVPTTESVSFRIDDSESENGLESWMHGRWQNIKYAHFTLLRNHRDLTPHVRQVSVAIPCLIFFTLRDSPYSKLVKHWRHFGSVYQFTAQCDSRAFNFVWSFCTGDSLYRLTGCSCTDLFSTALGEEGLNGTNCLAALLD
jgi:hypothetical protein